MGRGSSKASGKPAAMPKNVSSLAVFKENSKQFNDALSEGKRGGYYEVDYTDVTGQTFKYYWNGAKYDRKESANYKSLSEGKYKANGILKKKFKAPKEWQWE